MARKTVGPRWYASRKAYYVTIGGVTQCLGSDLHIAEQRYHRMMLAVGGADPQTVTVRAMLDAWLDHVRTNKRPSTYQVWSRLLAKFPGGMLCHDFQQKDFSAFLLERPTWKTWTRKTCATALRTAFSWAAREGLVSQDYGRGLALPPGPPRGVECLVTYEQYQRLLSQASAGLRDALVFLWETGCRPGVVRTATGRERQGDLLILRPIPGRKLKTTITVYMTEAAMAVLPATEDLLFVNTDDRPWGSVSFSNAIRALARLCGYPHIVAYSFRHSFAYRCIAKGIPIADIATLMSTSVALIEKTYGHGSSQQDRLRGSLARLS